MDVLGRMVEAVKPGRLVLDLQVIRPNPFVETSREFVCEIDGEPLFRVGDAATAAVDALVSSGRLFVRDRRHNPGEPTRHPGVEHTRSESRGVRGSSGRAISIYRVSL